METGGINVSKRALDGFCVDLLPDQKRKKFPPIVWDREDASSAANLPESGGVSRVDVLKKSCGEAKFEANDSPDCMNSTLTYQSCSSGDLEPGQLEDDSQDRDGGLAQLSHAPNILTSRWASDDEELHIEEVKLRGTPESGGSSSRWSEVENGADEVNDGKYFCESEVEYDEDDVPVSGIQDEPIGSMFQECRNVFEFEKLGKISEGSYGLVFKARDKKTGDLVALKKLKMGKEKEGFPLYYLREINNMLSFNHPSVLGIKEVVVDDRDQGFGDVYMVMEYVEHDLKALMESRKHRFSQSEVKCLMLQLLEGVEYLHANWVLHRDLKTANLLFSNQGNLKICDFGMARQYSSPLKPYTSLVVTLWYRAPELLLGANEYSTAVDMWSVGCIMAELLTGKPLFDGKTEAEQLVKIFKKLGTPNEQIWPGYSDLPGAKVNFRHQPYSMLQDMFPRTAFTDSPILSDKGIDLLSKLLTYDPAKRITAEDALQHVWFNEVPLAKSKEFMPTFPAQTTK